jgi:hypothetical protein
MKIHVAAYAASGGLDEAAEGDLYRGLAGLELAGLEQPYYGTAFHKRDDGWLANRIRPEWSLVVTLLPGEMDRLIRDRHFGLASANPDGRERAIELAESARRAIEKLHRTLGRRAVRAVMVHSAPRLGESGAKSSLEGFAESLTALRGRDWQGATLLVEHCDAAVPGRQPDKGFLRMEDDVMAVKLSSGKTPAGVAVNWGRSAIETRSAEGPAEHARRAVQADMLGALFFSGATTEDPAYGSWRDSHAPFSTSCPNSIMTPQAAKAVLAEAPSCPIVGLKLQTKPDSLTVAERLAVILDGIQALS